MMKWTQLSGSLMPHTPCDAAVGMAGPSPTALTPEAKGSRGGRFTVQVKAGFAEIIPVKTLL
jgi:hypothetical protein